uniref:NAD(P)H-quinone oxidoreductase subunit 5, chloroplastic n=5 Tax=Epimedium TaxID=63350 RepID=A0A144Z127_9MAGN|nr:NADH-plastoquinone oxidoreductase subunit 5 [Epimedium dolichostemon]YP_009746457.1 NADH-plastoquinone oxidoreductase subunit 5 [Epimedium brevicornu]YP_010014528.1 NADH-plastoquinone oxidoreductase subunit 5 [Epimedium dewuense]YP_010014698.1 NADH-plastoquinone oxidoreductase subunit 5 [Epimedium simplicifolium]YP_010342715.1 NADH-plastoquinone oxidoreductase subunit 5 [Epimedium truncatum]QOI13493.1 NADH-plastoquinone oxidoreductase subunit 5 [Epimedium pubescens]QXO06900.1 NADH-plastoqu
MEHTYQYAWIIPFVPLPVPIAIGVGLLLFPTATKSLRRMWVFPSVLLLSIIMIFSADLAIYQINVSIAHQYVWSWTIHNDFSLEFGYLIDPLTSIMLLLITTVGIMVLIYSDNYMSHDQGYLRFFAYMSLSNASMLGLVTSSNLIQIYFFWELVGMCSFLLIGFWFTRPIAASACQKAFVTNRVGDFGLLLGILGFYFITGSFDFRNLFEITKNLIDNDGFNSLFLTFFASLLFVGAVAKSAQFPLHVWLPDAMEGPTPISALIHAATMVAAGIFLVARLIPLFISIPYVMNFISLIGMITLLLGATLALAQRDIKRSLAYSTISQLGYTMLALGMGSYRVALFHLITHAYSKALLFLGSGSIIHSMETCIGYSPEKIQNMALMGGLTKYLPITKTSFLLGTLSLCGIPPLACFWSKDEILYDSWGYSPLFAIIASFTAGLTAFYMFRMYLLTFEGHLNVYFQNFNGKKNSSFYSLSIWGKDGLKLRKANLLLSTINNIESVSLFLKKGYPIHGNARNVMRPLFTITLFSNKKNSIYPQESDNTMLFPLIVLVLFTCFIGSIGLPFDQKEVYFDILSKWLAPTITFLQSNSNNSMDSYEFVTNAFFSVSIAFFGIFIASLLYRPVYSSFHNFGLMNLFMKTGPKRLFWDQKINILYNWSYNCAYIEAFYKTIFISGIRRLAEQMSFFDRGVIDGITNGVGVISFFVGEGIKYMGGGRISSYLFFYLFYLSIFLFLVIYYLL